MGFLFSVKVVLIFGTFLYEIAVTIYGAIRTANAASYCLHYLSTNSFVHMIPTQQFTFADVLLNVSTSKTVILTFCPSVE